MKWVSLKLVMGGALLTLSLSCARALDEPQVAPNLESDRDQVSHEPQHPFPLGLLGYEGAVQALDFDLSASIGGGEERAGDDLRAIEGLRPLGGKLVPNIQGNVQVVMIFADESSSVTMLEEFSYSADEGTISLRKPVRLPDGYAGKAGLKVRLCAVPNGWFNPQTRSVEVPQQGLVFAGQRDEASRPILPSQVGLKLPYFSDWVPLIFTPERRIRLSHPAVLKPQGQIMRLELNGAYLENELKPRVKGWGFESNNMSRSGSYSLALENSSGEIHYTASDSERLVNDHYYWHEVDLDVPRPKDKTLIMQDYYLWAEGREGVEHPYTRIFLRFYYDNPPLTNPRSKRGLFSSKDYSGTHFHRFDLDRDWTGKNDPKEVAVGYNRNTYQSPGARLVINPWANAFFSPISGFSVSQIHGPDSFFSSLTLGAPPLGWRADSFPFMAKKYGSSFSYRGYYSYDGLAESGNWFYLPNQELDSYYSAGKVTKRDYFTLPNEDIYMYNGEGIQWQMASSGELKALFPPLSSGLIEGSLRSISMGHGTVIGDWNEKIYGKFVESDVTVFINHENGDIHDLSQGYSSFITAGEYSIYHTKGIRFSSDSDDGKDAYKHYYDYTSYLNVPDGSEIVEVKCIYLGPYYPDLQDAREIESFKGRMGTPELRVILPGASTLDKYFNISGGVSSEYYGRIWCSDSSPSRSVVGGIFEDHYGYLWQYFEYDFTKGNFRIVNDKEDGGYHSYAGMDPNGDRRSFVFFNGPVCQILATARRYGKPLTIGIR